MKRAWSAAAALLIGGAALAATAPAWADVKAGVDAWQRGDYKAAVAEWRSFATAGDADAQFNMGQAYKLGRGVPVDPGLAEEWYRKAAMQGHPQAEDRYGLILFENGKRPAAVPYLQKSSSRGEPSAQYVLSTMYFNGDSVERDWVRAYALMTRAVAGGVPKAPEKLAQMDEYVSLRDRQKGVELARQYETDATRQRNVAYAPPSANPDSGPRPIRTTEVPPSVAPKPVTPVPTRPTAKPPVAVAKAVPPPARPAPAGGWRVQLGGFKDAGNAQKLVATLRGKGAIGGLTPYLVRADGLTKLQLGSFGSNIDAAKACAAIKRAGSECVPVRG